MDREGDDAGRPSDGKYSFWGCREETRNTSDAEHLARTIGTPSIGAIPEPTKARHFLTTPPEQG